MSKRTLLAGLLGGVAMFVWMSLAHMVLPLGRAGVSEIPNEQGLLDAMRSTLGTSSGFYFFPGMGADADMQHYEQKLAANPSGILVYHPPGGKALTAPQLIVEFLTELIEALLLAWMIAQTRLAGFAPRLGFALVAGVAASMVPNIPYWNWYGFPTSYTLAYMSIGIIGFFVAGAVLAKMIPAPAA